ncbi:hypothetical protein LWI28_002022 [Acer negundo]|uniref:Uncharacterized protein n=1 Tax=Acer negundo TaxID=4023 RepID=A0AAD5IX37_ACENE|nr:hypothetical protein LWI28_002022 [Acer negundo]
MKNGKTRFLNWVYLISDVHSGTIVLCLRGLVENRKTYELHGRNRDQAVYSMDFPTATTPASGSTAETPRVKFLYSFLGSILP